MARHSKHTFPVFFAHTFWIFWIFGVFVFLSSVSFANNNESIDSETCLSCHEGLETVLNKSAHPLMANGTSHGLEISCVSCHSGGTEHIDDPTVDNIGNPGLSISAATEKVCIQCHQPHTGQGIAAFDVHADQDISCTNCHAVHVEQKSSDASLLCATCHTGVAADFLKRSHHPLREQNISCISCHDFTGNAEPNFGHGAAANCYSCHPGQSGPHLFEHAATSSFSVDGEGCISCHTPHASTNDRLLKQPDDKLCLQCHAAPPGHQNAHNGELTGYSCVDCHSQIHGSYDNLFLLDPQLANKVGGGPEGCNCHYYR